ncbi:MAG: hypothetical protein ACFFCQ_15745, partial [Promethearchaeota archaeon]
EQKEEETMKCKIIAIGVFLVLLLGMTTLIGPLRVAGYEYGVQVGDSFTFKINGAHIDWDIDIPQLPQYSTQGEENGIPFEDVTLNAGDSFDLRIDEVGSDYVEISIIIGTQEESMTLPALFDISTWSQFLWGSGIYGLLSSALAGEDIEIDMSWVILSVITYADDAWWEYLKNQLLSLAGQSSSEDAEFKFDDTNEEFGVVSQFDIDESEEGTTSKMNIDFRMVWDKATGVMKGVLIELMMDISSTSGTMDVNADFEVVQEGYDIEGFAEEGGMIPGYELFCLFPTIGALALIFKRRK